MASFCTGSQLHFHRDSITKGRFEDLREGDVVHYLEEQSDGRPTTATVLIAEDQGHTGTSCAVSIVVV